MKKYLAPALMFLVCLFIPALPAQAECLILADEEYAVMAAVSLARGGDSEGARALAEKVLPSVDREKFPAEWLALRLFYDRAGSTSEIELRIGAEKRLDMKAALLVWLGEYWIAKARPELGATYVGLALELDRQGTIWHRLAEAEAKRLGAARP